MLDPSFVGEVRPAWYEIGYAQGKIVLTVEPNAFAFVEEHLTSRNERVAYVGKAFGLAEFIPANARPWGFNRAIENVGETARGWRQCVVRLPRMIGVAGDDGWRCAYAAIGSLHVLFLALNNWRTPIAQREAQCVVVSLGLREGGLGVALSPRAAMWLRTQTLTDIERVRDAAMDAANVLGSVYDDDARREFPLQLDRGHVHIGLPGRVGLHPAMERRPGGEHGYELHDHNVDSPFHQLALLAAIGKLHELVRGAV